MFGVREGRFRTGTDKRDFICECPNNSMVHYYISANRRISSCGLGSPYQRLESSETQAGEAAALKETVFQMIVVNARTATYTDVHLIDGWYILSVNAGMLCTFHCSLVHGTHLELS
jgi:hypothetical protein